MPTEIKVPTLGESVTSATVARWIKKAGEAVAADEPIVELETDKVTVEVNAPEAGVLASIAVEEGGEVEVGALLGMLDAGAAAGAQPERKSAGGVGTGGADAKAANGAAPNGAAAPAPDASAGSEARPATPRMEPRETTPPAPPPAANPPAGVNPPPEPRGPVSRPAAPRSDGGHAPMPSAAKIMAERQVTADAVDGTGKDGRITKGDVLAFINRPAPAAAAPAAKSPRADGSGEERVKMTRLRRTIAQRLKQAQNEAAMLTTFNEVDMSAVVELRSAYKDAFEKKNKGIRLGFMSFFVRACVAGLREFPAVNAEIDGDDIIYKHDVHMGIAVGGPNGLVVPVIRDAHHMGFAQIEGAIADFGRRARDGALKLDELTGGTFSITNGGVYGSLMSTPILNHPQSAILGMHKIQERPMVVGGGKIEARPMMYLALSYDHRIVDGKEAVSFLVRVKEAIEDPRRLLLEV